MPDKTEAYVCGCLHLYQPPRHGAHHEFSGVQTDPQGIDWTKKILAECYRPLSQNGSLNRVSFDMYGVLRHEIGKLDSQTSGQITSALRENGLGDSYLHPPLPDLSLTDQRILIMAGREQFHKKTGRDPKVFWAPESGLSRSVLQVLAEAGYRAFVCAPEQIKQSDGARSDNQPTKIRLAQGAQIIALPMDRPMSSDMGYGQKLNADRFVMEQIVPAARARLGKNKALIWMTDGETFGHHIKGAQLFLQYLLFHALGDKGFTPVSVNTLLALTKELGEGTLVERTAWSCPHGDLVRWHGECPCCRGDAKWKQPFYSTLHILNSEVTAIVAKVMPKYSLELYTKFEQALMNPGGRASQRELSLLSAKASALAALTSCGTFFDDPHASGNINVLFARQALAHLRDAGFAKEADRLEEKLKMGLRRMPSWTYLGHKGTVIGDFLTS